MKTTLETSIEIDVPARTAYDQWTQLEDFPRFMQGVEKVEQIDDTHLRWRAKVGGVSKEWVAEICEQIPDKRIAWRSISGAWSAGVVTFHRISDERSRVMVQIDYEPEGLVENVGDRLGLARRRIEGDLESFKQFLETRQHPTGAWRGEVPSKDDA